MKEDRLGGRVSFDTGFIGDGCLIGLDEVGMGCLAGSLVIGGVMVTRQFLISDTKEVAKKYEVLERVRDSKKLSPGVRQSIADAAMECNTQYQQFYCMTEISDVEEINRYGLIVAHDMAMCRLASKMLKAYQSRMNRAPDRAILLVDGSRNIRNLSSLGRVKTVVNGDDQSFVIGLASIVAKTVRDKYMDVMHEHHPVYGWKDNKGYGTKSHIKAIAEHGVTALHRQKATDSALSNASAFTNSEEAVQKEAIQFVVSKCDLCCREPRHIVVIERIGWKICKTCARMIWALLKDHKTGEAKEMIFYGSSHGQTEKSAEAG